MIAGKSYLYFCNFYGEAILCLFFFFFEIVFLSCLSYDLPAFTWQNNIRDLIIITTTFVNRITPIGNYNHGKKCWYILPDSREKWPPFPQFNVDWSHVVRSQSQDLKHWQIGAGKDYVKRNNLCFLFEQCHASFLFLVVNIVIVAINCIRCANYFSMIVAEFHTLFPIT